MDKPSMDHFHPWRFFPWTKCQWGNLSMEEVFPGSFSWKRLLGIQGLKNSFARKTGILTTKEGWYRKIGRTIVRMIFK